MTPKSDPAHDGRLKDGQASLAWHLPRYLIPISHSLTSTGRQCQAACNHSGGTWAPINSDRSSVTLVFCFVFFYLWLLNFIFLSEASCVFPHNRWAFMSSSTYPGHRYKTYTNQISLSTTLHTGMPMHSVFLVLQARTMLGAHSASWRHKHDKIMRKHVRVFNKIWQMATWKRVFSTGFGKVKLDNMQLQIMAGGSETGMVLVQWWAQLTKKCEFQNLIQWR